MGSWALTPFVPFVACPETAAQSWVWAGWMPFGLYSSRTSFSPHPPLVPGVCAQGGRLEQMVVRWIRLWVLRGASARGWPLRNPSAQLLPASALLRGSCWTGAPQGHPVYQARKRSALSPQRASSLLRSPRGWLPPTGGFKRRQCAPPPTSRSCRGLSWPHLVTGMESPGLHGGFGGHHATFGGAVQPHTCTGFHSAAKKGLLHSQLGWGHVMKTAFRLSRPVPESVLTLPLRCTVQPFFIPRYFHNLGKHWVFCRPGRRRGVRSGLGLSGRLCSFSSVPGTESCARQMLWKYVLVG